MSNTTYDFNKIDTMKRSQLVKFIKMYELPIVYDKEAIKLIDLRTMIKDELIRQNELGEIEFDMINIPTGTHAETEDKKQKLYQTPSGTELLLVLEKMLEKADTRESNIKIQDFGFEGKRNIDEDYNEEEDDDYYDEDDDRSFNLNYRDYRNGESSSNFEKRTGMKPLKEISPSLFFQFIKSKLDNNQQIELSTKMSRIASCLENARMLDQQGLYEELALKLSGISREQEASVVNCGKYIPFIAINYFIEKMSQLNIDNKKVVKFDFLKNFPRNIPSEKAKIISDVKDKKVFDQFFILYTDYTREKLKTTRTKIRDKDPIVFGAFIHQPERLYYVCDWVDEFCDITLEKFLDLTFDNAELGLKDVEITDEYIKNIQNEVNRRHLRLKQTNMTNYRKLMREEEKDRLKEVITPKSWFGKLMEKIKS